MVKISNSEIETFLRCRRMWDYSSESRQSLRSLSPSPHSAFHVGGVMHKILEAQVQISRRPNILAIIEEAEEELEEYYRGIVGVGWSTQEREQVENTRELIIGMANHYFSHYGDVQPLGEKMRYIHAELTFEVPIPDTEHFLRGTIDGIAENDEGEIYLVEHKTTSMGFPEAKDLQAGRQLQVYVWASRELLSKPVAGIIYDGIAKKIPTVPKVTQRGTLSLQAIDTTLEIYQAAIKACGLDEADYAEMLAKLSGPSKFFRRHVISFPQRSLDLFNQQLKQLATDMANPELPLYPNRVWQGCWDCRYQDLCTAEQLGEDIDTVKMMKYKKAGNRGPSAQNKAVTKLNLSED